MEIHSIPVISTAHLTREVAERLSKEGNNNPWCPCASWEHGFFVHLDDLEARAVEGEPTPRCLIEIRDWMRKKNLSAINGDLNTRADWVRLDQDADTVNELNSYPW